MIRRRAPRPTRGGRVTGTPRARRRLRRLGPNTPDIRPVRKKPVLRSVYSPKTTGALGSVTGGKTAKLAANQNPMSQGEKKAYIEKLKKALASKRAGKARSTGTPKMTKRPATRGRMTRKPTAVGRPRRVRR